MPEETVGGQRIDSWKEIAAYLGRDIRTAIRWEKERGLPVRRVPGGKRQAVFAFRHELDQWLGGYGTSQNIGPAASTNGTIAEAAAAEAPPPAESQTMAMPELRGRRSRFALYAAGWGLIAGLATLTAYLAQDARLSLRTPQVVNQERLTQNGREKTGLLTDGKTLYFGQEQDGRYALAAMPAEGGTIRVIWTPPANVMPIDLSPDHTRILALTGVETKLDQELWVIPVESGAPHRLANVVAHSAAWSPDGKIIAFALGTAIYWINPDGSAMRVAGSYSGTPLALRWSEDGRRLRFLLEDVSSRKTSYWELAPYDGLKTTTLRSLPFQEDWSQSWTRGLGKDAYFVSGKDPGNTALWLIRHGSRLWEPAIEMTALHLGWHQTTAIAFAPDTRRLFALNDFSTRRTMTQYDSRTKSYRPVLPGVTASYLDYSRDGHWVAFVTLDRGLWVSRIDGTGVRQLTFPPEEVELPRWSPDGKEIAYSVKSPNGPWRIWIAQRNSGKKREASEGSESQGAPTWSPDGRFLAYGNLYCGETHACAVHRIDLETGKEWTLPGSEGLWTARWSPDGRFIAAIQSDRHELLVLNIQTGKWRKIAAQIDGTDLEWSSDSQYLYTNLPGAEPRIVRFRLEDGSEETMLNLRSQDSFDLADAHDDLGFSMGPGDLLVLHRRMHAAEIYAYDLREQ